MITSNHCARNPSFVYDKVGVKEEPRIFLVRAKVFAWKHKTVSLLFESLLKFLVFTQKGKKLRLPETKQIPR